MTYSNRLFTDCYFSYTAPAGPMRIEFKFTAEKKNVTVHITSSKMECLKNQASTGGRYFFKQFWIIYLKGKHLLTGQIHNSGTS